MIMVSFLQELFRKKTLKSGGSTLMHSKIRFSMGQFTQKYAIVQFFEDIEEGYVYSSNNWPLHSTVVDTFAIKWSIDEMVVKLTETH